MAAGNQLNYYIAVQMSENKALRDLLDTLRAIQDLSNKEAQLRIAINPASLDSLSRDVADAAERGVQQAASRGRSRRDNTGGGNGNGSKIAADLSAAAADLRAMASMLGGMVPTQTVGAAGGSGRAPSSVNERRKAGLEEILQLLNGDQEAQQKGMRAVRKLIESKKLHWEEMADAVRMVDDGMRTNDQNLVKQGTAKGNELSQPGRVARFVQEKIAGLNRKIEKAVQEGVGGDVSVQPMTSGTRIVVDVAGMQRVFDEFLTKLGNALGEAGDRPKKQPGLRDRSVMKAYEVKDYQADEAKEAIEGNALADAARKRDQFLRKAEALRSRASGTASIQKRADLITEASLFEGQAQAIDNRLRETSGLTYARPMTGRKMDQLTDAMYNDPTSIEAFTGRKIGRGLNAQNDIARSQQVALAKEGIQASASLLGMVATRGTSRQLGPLESDANSLRSKIVGLEAALADTTLSATARAQAENARLETEKELAGKEREMRALRFYDANQQVRSGSAIIADQYRREGNVGMQKIIEDQLRKIDEQFTAQPNLRRQSILIPQAVGEYVTKVFRQYTDMLEKMALGTGQVDPALLKFIADNRLMSGIIRPLTADELKDGVNQDTVNKAQARFREFSTQTLIGRYGREDLILGAPQVNPVVERDTGVQSVERKIADIQAWWNRGGSFAVQTAERRKWAEGRVNKVSGFIEDAKKRKDVLEEMKFEKEREELLQEIEFGGRYFMPGTDSARNVISGRLASTREVKNYAKGGALSDAIRGQAFEFGPAMLQSTQATNGLAEALKGADTQLDALNSGIAALAATNLDPVIERFQQIATAFQPIAQSLRVLAGTTGGSQLQKGAIAATTAGEKERAIQRAKTDAVLERRDIRARQQAEKDNEIALRQARAAIERSSIQLPITLDSEFGDPDQAAAAYLLTRRTFQQLSRSQNRQRDLAVQAEALNNSGLDNTSLLKSGRRESSMYIGTAGLFAQQLLASDKGSPGVYTPDAVRAASDYTATADQLNPARRDLFVLRKLRDEQNALNAKRASELARVEAGRQAQEQAQQAESRVNTFSLATSAYYSEGEALKRREDSLNKANDRVKALEKQYRELNQESRISRGVDPNDETDKTAYRTNFKNIQQVGTELETARKDAEKLEAEVRERRARRARAEETIRRELGPNVDPKVDITVPLTNTRLEYFKQTAGELKSKVTSIFGTRDPNRSLADQKDREARIAELDKQLADNAAARQAIEQRLASGVAKGRDIADTKELIKLQRELTQTLKERADVLLSAASPTLAEYNKDLAANTAKRKEIADKLQQEEDKRKAREAKVAAERQRLEEDIRMRQTERAALEALKSGQQPISPKAMEIAQRLVTNQLRRDTVEKRLAGMPGVGSPDLDNETLRKRNMLERELNALLLQRDNLDKAAKRELDRFNGEDRDKIKAQMDLAAQQAQGDVLAARAGQPIADDRKGRRLQEIDRRLADNDAKRRDAERKLSDLANDPSLKATREQVRLQKELNNLTRQRETLLAREADIVQGTNGKTRSFIADLGDKMRSMSQYLLAGGVIYTLANEIRQQVSKAIEIESEIKRLQGIFDDKSNSSGRFVATGMMSAASDYGVGLSESIRAGRAFAQTGASPQRSVEMTRASLAAQVGAGLEANQATELLIAVENITNGRVGSMEVLDRISRIESQYAVSSQDLSEAIQKAGSLAQQLQPQALGAVDALDTIIGAATAIIERTRVSGNQAATALRFLIARVTSPEVGRALQDRFGVNLAGKNPGELRPLQDILADISTRYKELKESGQTVKAQELLVTFAGARQTNTAAALLEDFNKAMEVAAESAFAYGDTQARVNLQLDTVQARFQQFQTALTGFSYTLLNGSGVGALAKTGLRAGTALFETASGTAGLAGIGGALFGVGALSRRFAQQRLSAIEAAKAPAPATGLLDASGKPFSAALQNGAVVGAQQSVRVLTAMEKVGSTLATIGTTAAIIAAFEGIGRLVNAGMELYDITRGKNFNFGEFEQSAFFQDFSDQAMRFGLGPVELSRQVGAIAQQVVGDIESDPKFGKNAFATGANAQRNPALYEESIKRFVKQLDESLPGFAALGDQAERTSVALNLLKESARFAMVVPQAAIAEFNKDLGDLTNSLSDKLVDLRSVLTSAANPANSAYSQAKLGAAPTRMASGKELAEGIKSGIGNVFRFNGLPVLNGGALRFAGKSIDEIIGNRGGTNGLQALDDFARQNLLVDGTVAARLRTAEATLAAKNLTITAESRYQEALKGLTKATDKQKEELLAASQRLANQDALAQQFVDQMKKFLDKDGRLQQVRVDQGNLTGLDSPGSAFVAAVRQTFESARRKLQKEFSQGAISEAGFEEGQKLLRRLQSPDTRPAMAADLFEKLKAGPQIRERLLEPFLNYALRSKDIQTQEGLRKDFGFNFNAIQARADAAQQFVTDTAQVPTKLLGDLAREQIKYLLTSNRNAGEVVRAYNLQDEDNQRLYGLGPAMITQMADSLSGNADARRAARQRLGDLQAQYNIAVNEGLGGFLQDAMGSKNKDVREQAKALRDNLSTLLEGIKELKPDDVDKFLQLKGGIDKIIEAAKGIAKIPIEEAQRFAQRMEDIQAVAADRLSLGANTTQFNQLFLQEQLQRAQLANNPLGALGIQQALVQEARAARDQQARTALQRAEDEFSLNPETADSRRAVLRARRDYGRALSDSEQQGTREQLQLLTQASLENQRSRKSEAAQLNNDMIVNPLRQFLMSSRNFGREGYQNLLSGVGQAAQSRLVDIFLNRVFGESGVLGAKITESFNNGALTTQTAIQRGFALAVDDMLLKMRLEATNSSLRNLDIPVDQVVLGADGKFSIQKAGSAVAGVSAAAGAAAMPKGTETTGSGGLTLPGASTTLSTAANSRFQFKGKYGDLLNAGLPLIGSLGGAMLGNVWGKKNNFGQEGAAIGSLIGSMTPLGPIGGLIGGMIGGLAGGALGKGKSDEIQTEALQKIERNTRESVQALESQTALLRPDSRFLNVPAGFTIPAFRPFGVGSGGGAASVSTVNNIEVNISAAAGTDPNAIGRAVAAEISRQLSGAGNSFDSRTL